MAPRATVVLMVKVVIFIFKERGVDHFVSSWECLSVNDLGRKKLL